MAAVTLPPDKRTLLTMVQNACAELALTQPTSLFGNADPQATQLLALAQREGYFLSQRRNGIGGWQALRTEYQFTTAGSGNLTGNFTNGSAIVTGITSTSTIVAGQTVVQYSLVPVGTTVLTVDSPTQITMSAQASFSTGTGTAQGFYTGKEAYPLPTDIDHQMTKTYWDRSYRWQLLGPLDPQERQVLLSGIAPAGPRRRFWIINNNLILNPVPSDATGIEVFEYYSNAWCQSGLTTSATTRSRFAADTDYFILDDNCMELGLKWRFRKAKGLSFDVEQDDYEMAVETAIASDGGSRDLPLNASADGVPLLGSANIPDTGFGT